MPPNRDATSRPNDYIYGKYYNSSNSLILKTVLDPLFIVSGPKDHLKAALIAKASMAKFVSGHPLLSPNIQHLLNSSKYVQYFPACSPICPTAPDNKL